MDANNSEAVLQPGAVKPAEGGWRMEPPVAGDYDVYVPSDRARITTSARPKRKSA